MNYNKSNYTIFWTVILVVVVIIWRIKYDNVTKYKHDIFDFSSQFPQSSYSYIWWLYIIYIYIQLLYYR